MANEKVRKTVVKSIRGETVDFDLMEIKSQIVSIQPNDLAKERDALIRLRRQRVSKRMAAELASKTVEVVVEPSNEVAVVSDSLELEIPESESVGKRRRIVK